jgi:hypothetical protein
VVVWDVAVVVIAAGVASGNARNGYGTETREAVTATARAKLGSMGIYVDVGGCQWLRSSESKQRSQWARGQWDYKGGCDADADGHGNGCVGAG